MNGDAISKESIDVFGGTKLFNLFNELESIINIVSEKFLPNLSQLISKLFSKVVVRRIYHMGPISPVILVSAFTEDHIVGKPVCP